MFLMEVIYMTLYVYSWAIVVTLDWCGIVYKHHTGIV